MTAVTPLSRALVREWIARRGGVAVDPADVAIIAAAGPDRVDESLRALRSTYGDRTQGSNPALHLNSALGFAARAMGLMS